MGSTKGFHQGKEQKRYSRNLLPIIKNKVKFNKVK